MKNNTKLIMETWRRFLKEGPEGIDPDGMVVDEEEEEVNASNRSPVEDKDLESDRNMIDMDDMGEFNPYESSPIPPEGLDREDDYDDSIDHSAIDYFADNNIPHDQFGNPLDDSLEAPEEFTESFNDQDSEDFADYDKEMQRLRRK